MSTDEDLVLEVNSRGGIPLGLVSYLLRAVGAAYPNTSMKTGGGDRFGHAPTLQLLIPKGAPTIPSRTHPDRGPDN